MCFFVCVIIPSRTFHDGIFFRANFSLFMRFNGENSLRIPKKKKEFSSDDDCFAALVFAISF